MTHGAILLVDTCDERSSIALCLATGVNEQRVLPERKASSQLAPAVGALLREHGVEPKDLQCVGVVNGPGSFTGLRIGLSFAKGFCLATGVPLLTVSRLAVLAHAAQVECTCAVADAGREAVYLRELSGEERGRERMFENRVAAQRMEAQPVAFTSQELAARFPQTLPVIVDITAWNALPLIQARLAEGLFLGTGDLETADANYVRDEAAIYSRGSARCSP